MRALRTGRNDLPMKTKTTMASTTGLMAMARRLRTSGATQFVPLLLLLAPPVAVQAQDYSYTTGNGQVTITGFAGPGGAVAIPSTIDGLPVTTIGSGAFYGISSLTGVTIPDSVTGIGNYAFSGCTSLTRVTIGNGVTALEEGVFNRCTRLAGVIIPNSVTNLGSGAF